MPMGACSSTLDAGNLQLELERSAMEQADNIRYPNDRTVRVELIIDDVPTEWDDDRLKRFIAEEVVTDGAGLMNIEVLKEKDQLADA